ncbi:PAAR domain-containing protein [uncultured Paludibaculum sp.]|uniref:PAAR domain-containing protein n=1 Tax=uncultured Paludibaculum sp. TaxID=1765020 RepID=UPI002AAAB14D|nr:PAAR domain-containing protein [uncultured Paludibaculum sp.]
MHLHPNSQLGGPIVQGVETVITGNQKQSTVTHLCLCPGPPTDPIAAGADTVLVANLPAARLGDPTIQGGIIVEGCQSVLIGNEPAPVTTKPAASGLPTLD